MATQQMKRSPVANDDNVEPSAVPHGSIATSPPIMGDVVRDPSWIGRRRAQVADIIFLTLLIVVGAAIRLDFLLASGPVLDADEAIVGLMAKHIQEGRGVPVFYYGQHYMGSLEAILASLSFELFGRTAFSLQLVPFLWSLLLIPVVFILARECGGGRTARLAAAFAAIPPVSLIVWSSKARGGFIEIVVISGVALIVAARWVKRDIFDTRYAAAVGIITGLGWWINNQILYAMIPIAAVVAVRLFEVIRVSRPVMRGIFQSLRVGMVGVIAFLIGGSPYWIYNIEHEFASLGMFSRASKSEIISHLEGLFTTALPILMGAKHFWEADTIFSGASAIYYTMYGALFGVVLWRYRRSFLKLLTLRTDHHSPIVLVALFGVISLIVFVTSTFGWLVQAPRYLLPAYIAAFILLSLGITQIAYVSRSAAAALAFIVIALNVVSCYYGGRVIPGQPVVYAGQRVAHDHTPLIDALDKLGIHRVRTNYWIGYRLAFETDERITFAMFQEPSQVRIEEYQLHLDGEDPQDLPLVLVPAQAPLVERGLQASGYTYQRTTVDGYVIFHNLEREIPASVAIDPSMIARVSGWGEQDPHEAIDGRLNTRWGTGGHQRPGQQFRVEFQTPIPLVSMHYVLGKWMHDLPRGLIVQIERPDGGIVDVLDGNAFEAIRYFETSVDDLTFVFPRIEARAVVLTQTKSDPIFDWSIAELRFSRVLE